MTYAQTLNPRAHRKFVRSYLSTGSTRQRVEKVLLLLVESGALYCGLSVRPLRISESPVLFLFSCNHLLGRHRDLPLGGSLSGVERTWSFRASGFHTPSRAFTPSINSRRHCTERLDVFHRGYILQPSSSSVLSTSSSTTHKSASESRASDLKIQGRVLVSPQKPGRCRTFMSPHLQEIHIRMRYEAV